MTPSTAKPNVLLICTDHWSDVEIDLTVIGEWAKRFKDLLALLVKNSYGNDSEWIRDGRVVGLPDKPFVPGDIRGLCGQRGLRFM